MKSPSRRPWSIHHHPAAVAALVVVASVPAFGQSNRPEPRGGGLLPTRESTGDGGRLTRDEVLRRYDLNADGRVDEGEAETARMRMRRERIESQRTSGIDPLTGRPRAAAASPPATPPADDDLLLLPGGPNDTPPLQSPQRPQPSRPSADERKPVARPQPATPAGRSPALTGGVRAGAPAVRPGYGATGGKSDLNAGRPREPQAAARGAAERPGMPPATRATPRPGLFPPSQRATSAEDIGR
ncbi:MAG: hypothetical protein EBR28_04365 [Planctomycetia bacterium]|nr:hypothetical protein [Planctomycetia bacterium]